MIKNKKATADPKNNYDKCFHYIVAVALDLEKIDGKSKIISKDKSFIDKYNWKRINYSSGENDWKKLEKIIQQLLYMFKKKNIYFLPTFQDRTQTVKSQLSS